MKKAFSTFILLVAFAMFASLAWTADVTETLTFQWEDTNSPAIMQDWRLYWTETPGGPYDTDPVAIIPYAGTGPTFSSPATAEVTGSPASHVIKHFVLVACGNMPKADGTTEYLCSGNSNEISHDFWIPAGAFSVPVQFQIISTP